MDTPTLGWTTRQLRHVHIVHNMRTAIYHAPGLPPTAGLCRLPKRLLSKWPLLVWAGSLWCTHAGSSKNAAGGQ